VSLGDAETVAFEVIYAIGSRQRELSRHIMAEIRNRDVFV
jgi:hypothetical protein